MNTYITRLCTAAFFIAFLQFNALPQNPIIRNQFSADPSARVFGGKVYLFPSHDIPGVKGHRERWFCMEDYHVFSSSNLTEWTDHGVIVTQNKVPWVRPDSYSMWAPDCIERNGKYYFYFPTAAKDTAVYGRGFAIGVAVANKPEGPYTPEATPIVGVHGIDPNVFIDKDGQAYLYWSAGNIYGAKLKSNMLELDSKVDTLGDLPKKGLKEGPYLFERNGIYYLTYPHVENKIERLEYAMGNNPLGPFKFTGVIMDESASGCWTNHHSFINFKDQWYLFYHDKDYSPGFDKLRSVRADSLSFNADGTIKKVMPTLRGIGISDATKEIQIDRYTTISKEGAAVDFIDTTNRFLGWKIVFSKPGSWVQYNTVDLGKRSLKKILVHAVSETGGTLQVRTGSTDGKLIAEIMIPQSNEWKTVKGTVLNLPKGIQNIFVMLKDEKQVAVDWIKFE